MSTPEAGSMLHRSPERSRDRGGDEGRARGRPGSTLHRIPPEPMRFEVRYPRATRTRSSSKGRWPVLGRIPSATSSSTTSSLASACGAGGGPRRAGHPRHGAPRHLRQRPQGVERASSTRATSSAWARSCSHPARADHRHGGDGSGGPRRPDAAGRRGATPGRAWSMGILLADAVDPPGLVGPSTAGRVPPRTPSTPAAPRPLPGPEDGGSASRERFRPDR